MTSLIQLIPDVVKGVLFDADGTLFSLARPISEEYRSVCESLGVNFETKSLENIVSRTWRAMEKEYLNEEDNYSTTQERERSFWHSFATRVVESAAGKTPSDEVVTALYERYASPETRLVRDGVYETLSQLKDRGLILGVLTNNDSRTKKIVSKLPLSTFLDHIFTAGDLGWKKPSIKCFRSVENCLGLKPSELLYVGDDLQRDVYPAKASGWHAVWLNAEESAPPHEVIQITSFLC